VTFINVFEISADDIDGFMAEWKERAEFMRTQRGFRSFRLYRALSPDARYQLVNVAEWDTADDLRAATSDERFQASILRSAAQYDVSASPAVYRAAVTAGL
jgi:heme-degrading monooxygenase HmoA